MEEVRRALSCGYAKDAFESMPAAVAAEMALIQDTSGLLASHETSGLLASNDEGVDRMPANVQDEDAEDSSRDIPTHSACRDFRAKRERISERVDFLRDLQHLFWEKSWRAPTVLSLDNRLLVPGRNDCVELLAALVFLWEDVLHRLNLEEAGLREPTPASWPCSVRLAAMIEDCLEGNSE